MLSIFKRKVNFSVWSNLDGSPGGEVAETAEVDLSAIIREFAIVMPGAKVGANVVIMPGEIVSKSNFIFSDKKMRLM